MVSWRLRACDGGEAKLRRARASAALCRSRRSHRGLRRSTEGLGPRCAAPEGQALGKNPVGACFLKLVRSPRGPRRRPGASPRRIKARLAEQVATLLEASQRFDADRLHQEAIMLATKIEHPPRSSIGLRRMSRRPRS